MKRQPCPAFKNHALDNRLLLSCGCPNKFKRLYFDLFSSDKVTQQMENLELDGNGLRM